MPYIEEIMSIGRATNGYVLKIHVPYAEEDVKAPLGMTNANKDKVIVCTDVADLSEKITSIVPLLGDMGTAEKAFNNAFKEIEYE
jgi:hypothetical protein